MHFIAKIVAKFGINKRRKTRGPAQPRNLSRNEASDSCQFFRALGGGCGCCTPFCTAQDGKVVYNPVKDAIFGLRSVPYSFLS